MLLSDLPNDVLISVLQHIHVNDLCALARASSIFYNLVNTFGWQLHIRLNPRPSFSLAKARQIWHPRLRVRYDTLADKSWSSSHFIARPLSRPWPRKQQPSLAINELRLVVAAGNTLYSYAFGTPSASGSPPLQYEGSFSLRDEKNSQWDITALAFVDDNGEGRTLVCGFRNGTFAHVVLAKGDTPNTLVPTVDMDISQHTARDIIESISSDGSLYVSLSSRGKACLTNTQSSTSTPSSCIDLATRSWSSYISHEASYAAFGCSSPTTPLSVHSILEDNISHKPTAILGMGSNQAAAFSSAVYGICRAPYASPWGASPQTLISGWYDGKVRCYDLRSSSTESNQNSSTTSDSPAPLRPVMTLHDPWSIEPVYSVSSGGGTSSHLAAGSARHSLLTFWDIRYPKAGWSVYAPGNDRSPVYSVLLESSRVFGATDSRPFVYDFGPNVTQETYPHLSSSPGLKPRKSNPAGYYVTRYNHGHGSLMNEH